MSKIRYIIFFFGLSFQVISGFSQANFNIPQLAERERLRHLQIHQPAPEDLQANGDNIDVRQYVCHWWINPENDSIRGKVCIVFKALQNNTTVITLDMASNLVVTSKKFRSFNPAHNFPNTRTLRINLSPQVMNLGEVDSIVIWYKGRPIPSPFGSYSRILHEGVPVIYTLSEPYGAKDWWPCKQSLTDKADSVDFTISCPQEYRAATNGLLVSETVNNSIRSSRWKHKYPCATYLLALAVTNYQFFSLKAGLSSGDTLPIDHYCYPESFTAWSAEMLPIVKIMHDFDSLLGPYPFAREKYGHVQFAFGGGMEHQTISFMGNTDFGLQSHELVHHWFGNLITCGSWKDIWLNEGFASYMDAMEQVRANVNTWQSIATSWQDYFFQDPSGSVYCTDTTDIYRIFSGRLSYIKGGYLLHMLRKKMGTEPFYTALRNYLNDPALRYGFATTPDLKNHLEQVYGQSLTNFFDDWFYGQGFPTYQIESWIDGNQVQVIVNQTQSHPSVSFFNGRVPLRFYNSLEDSLVILDINENGQAENLQLNFSPTGIEYDPEKEILAKWQGSWVVKNQEIMRRKLAKMNSIGNTVSLSSENGAVVYQVLDGLGRKIKSSELSNQKTHEIQLPSGVYYFMFQQGHLVDHQKLCIW